MKENGNHGNLRCKTLFYLEAQNAAAPMLPRFKNQKPAAGGARIAKYG